MWTPPPYDVLKLNSGNFSEVWPIKLVLRPATLISIIQANVAPGSVIHSDEWAAYRSLSQLGYIHETVNHQHNFVDPATGAHTQLIERSWLDAKMKLLRWQRGVPGQHLQSHLDYYCWWRMRKNEDLLAAFVRHIDEVMDKK